MIKTATDTQLADIPRYDGKNILEGLNFKSAIRVQDTVNGVTWLVETITGKNILIEVSVISYLGTTNEKHYRVYYGIRVDEFKQQFNSTQSNSHHLLTQMV